MQPINKDIWYKNGERILLAGFFLAALLLCSLIPYTDGDDAYFSSMAHSMGFWEYIKMRYVGWEGRVTSEAMTYITFYFGKTFWIFANACILTLLPVGIVRIVKKMPYRFDAQRIFYVNLAVFVGILLLDLSVLGYGAFWITGSVFYLWSIVAGLWAAIPFVNLVFQKDFGGTKSFLYAIPCGFIAAMGQEQIAAVVITFGFLAVGYHYFRTKKIAWLHLVEVLVMTVALVVLFLSPGTEARSQSEISTWMPQFATMSLGGHIFITAQWLLSSLANESKALLLVIWILGAMLLSRRQEKNKMMQSAAAIFVFVAALPWAGITFFSDMGMGVADNSVCVTEVATVSSINGQNWIAIGWWVLACLFTLAMLWRLWDTFLDKAIAVLLFLAALASEALMFFSPTMYASGGRVLFVAEILLWLLVAMLFVKLTDKMAKFGLLLIGMVGLFQLLNRMSYLLSFF